MEKFEGATEDYICSWPTVGPVKRCHIPNDCLGQDIVVGIDEAGRGPVLGSLVYCAAFWPVSKNEEICKMGFDDSKQLKEGQREGFFDDIRRHPSIGYIIEELDSVTISKEMLRANPISLNLISYNSVIRMLEKIRDLPCDGKEMNVTDVYVDTVGDPEHYKSILVRAMGNDFADKFTIEKKADATYKVVGAASIIAKVTRDRILHDWDYPEHSALNGLDKNFGSGYPGDENCANWIQRAYHPVFGFPNIVRFSWGTAREYMTKNDAINLEWECDEEDSQSGALMTMFTSANEKTGTKRKRTGYYSKLKMKHLDPAIEFLA